MIKNIDIELLIGLPGSGKSTYAKSQKSKNTLVICIDDERWHAKTIQDAIRSGIKGINVNTKKIILDGLFLNEKEITDALTFIAEYFDNVSVTIHWWNEDRDSCLKNDGGRRETSAANTILNAEYKKPNIEKLNEYLKDWDTHINEEFVYHNVQLKPDWFRHFRAHTYITEDNKLRSYKWCNGGSAGSCWDNYLIPVSAEPPAKFTQLDNLLAEICPQITFLHYKIIQDECVYTEDSYQGDYYGGGCHYLNWVCDLEKLYEMIKKFGYV